MVPVSDIEILEKELELRQIYNEFVEVTDPAKLEKVQEILLKIGTVDAEVEGLSSIENQRDLSIKFHWGHNHRFNEKLFIGGRMGDRHLNLMAQFMRRYDLGLDYFVGKSVIDVGCWTGGTLLLLKALGAGRLLALEEVQKYAVVASSLALDIYEQEDVLCDGGNVYDLESTDRYDVVYFPGVIYHLSDPVLALRRLYNATEDGGEIFVETMGLDSPEPICEFHGNRVFHNDSPETREELNRGGWNWFIPSPSCLENWLLEAGFEEINCHFSQHSRRVFGYGKRKRFQDITRAGLSLRSIE